MSKKTEKHGVEKFFMEKGKKKWKIIFDENVIQIT